MSKIVRDVILTKSTDETLQLGRRIATGLRAGDILYLYGELGSGKTVLVKGICQGLGVDEEVTSSSFVIASEYKGRVAISHIDLYRLDKNSTGNLPLAEYIFSDGITLIEWADRIGEKYPHRLDIHIRIIDENKREIRVENSRH